MKANAPKRKVFSDAVDLLTGETPAAVAVNEVKMLSLAEVRPFHNHPFYLYKGERLEEMTESVREHGILTPVIVQKMADGYEMLAGHNRMEAARRAGITEIPAIVKEGLTEHEAYVYVIETNMLQRAFSELSISEKAAVLAERYDKVMSQGKRNDIIQELEALQGTGETCGHSDHKSKSRDSLGEEFGLSGSSVARLLRVNQLVPEVKEKLDAGEMNLMAAVQMSYVPEDVQKAAVGSGKPISKEMASKLRNEAVTTEKATEIIRRPERVKEKIAGKNVKIPTEMYERYFHKMDAEKVAEIIGAALKAWFSEKEDAGVHVESADGT